MTNELYLNKNKKKWNIRLDTMLKLLILPYYNCFRIIWCENQAMFDSQAFLYTSQCHGRMEKKEACVYLYTNLDLLLGCDTFI